MGAWITTLLESFTSHCKNILREAIYEIANRFFNSFVYACAFVPWVIGVAILLVSYLSSHWQVSSDFNNGLWRWCNKSDCGFVPRSSYNKVFLRCAQVSETLGLLFHAVSVYAWVQVVKPSVIDPRLASWYKTIACLCSIAAGSFILIGCAIFWMKTSNAGPSFSLAALGGMLHLPCGVLGLVTLKSIIRTRTRNRAVVNNH
ncbi:uncharacterized protein LOC112557796 [Pomacea canaliculata]|uniref:uncharacterized protein LOC112557796 n=1 Tax=Pomacea canaliculata TaxID=400727 RepID=UPI000D727FFE|nr:uncharacterized protein LOC112557796 [Pomacea canaliculata]